MRSAPRPWPQPPGRRPRLHRKCRVIVIGGGIAGVAAATILAERGASVRVIESETYLGGRAGAWTEHLPDGEPYQMERGFHAFFRHYYNLRALLRRVDPNLECLRPVDDYPILGRGGLKETFSSLPTTPPFNVISLTRRTPYIDLRDLWRINVIEALSMLRFDEQATYRKYDHQSAGEYLRSLRFPAQAKNMLFNVFAHSFFNPEDEMSAGELLMMFHFYFMGNPEGLIFDVVDQPFSAAIWQPLARYLEERSVAIELGTRAETLSYSNGSWRVTTANSGFDADYVVIATTVSAAKDIITSSPELAAHLQWRRQIESLDITRPFAVLRLWVNRRHRGKREAFAGTTGVGCLDNISLYHLFEDESAAWAERSGGSVVELHAYTLPVDFDRHAVRDELIAGLHELYPEYREAAILHEHFSIRRDCPAFAPGSHAQRPSVETPHRGILLAGDYLKLPIPSALMERAATSGFLAANAILRNHDVIPEPIHSVPRRGILRMPTWEKSA